MSIDNKVSQVNHATFFNKIYKRYIHNTNIALITFIIQMGQESKQGDNQGLKYWQEEVPIKFRTPFKVQGMANGELCC